jgi:hypothetical protein
MARPSVTFPCAEPDAFLQSLEAIKFAKKNPHGKTEATFHAALSSLNPTNFECLG